MTGSEKQIEWAESIISNLREGGFEAQVEWEFSSRQLIPHDGTLDREQIDVVIAQVKANAIAAFETLTETQQDASWWIDRRGGSPSSLFGGREWRTMLRPITEAWAAHRASH